MYMLNRNNYLLYQQAYMYLMNEVYIVRDLIK